jgi:hypothetical protein
MAETHNDDSDEQGPERSVSNQSGHELGPIAITTIDPAVETAVGHPLDWKTHADGTICVETTHVHESGPLYFLNDAAGDRRGPADGQRKEPGHSSGRGPDRQGHRQDGDHQGSGRDDRQGCPAPAQQPSMTKTLLITAGTGLLGGVIGAVGYLYMFAPKSDKSSANHSQAKAGATSKGDSESTKTVSSDKS